MKLNNKGWGFTEMIVLMTVLIIFLGIAVFFIYRLYNNLEANNVIKSSNPVNNSDNNGQKYFYSDLEYKLKNGAVKYVNNHYDEEITGDIVVSLKTLVNKNIITSIKDLKTNSTCSGYVKIIYENADYVTYKPYINCLNYTTSGYQESLDEK